MVEEEKNKTITFIALLFETILSIFMLGTTSSEEQQDYTTTEKWKIWFKNTFNFVNFKNIFKKSLKGFTYFIVIFSIINLLIFTPIIIGQLKSPRYPVARAYLKSAYMVNLLYIFPLSKIFGYGNPLTWGFYPVKDTLYKIGISKLPKDEGEREIWWFNIRFVEFKVVVQERLNHSYTYNDEQYKPLPSWQMRSFEKWNDELYSHILSWSSVKISDPKLKKEKLTRFLDLAETYISSTYVLGMKTQITEKSYKKEEHKYNLPGPKPNVVKNNINVINIFNNLKLNSAKYDKESYNFFEKNKKYEEDKFLYEAALDLLESKAQWGPSISCESPEVTILGNSHKNLMNYYNNNQKSLQFGEKITTELLTSVGIPGFTLKQCTNTPALKEYNEYFIEKVKRLDRFKNKKRRRR